MKPDRLNTDDYRQFLADRAALDAFERAFGMFGDKERRYADAFHVEARDGGEIDVPGIEARVDGAGRMIVTGHAAVFNRMSLELADMFGSFKEKIEPGAFDNVLDTDPHVTLNYLHDDRALLTSTRATPPLELSTNARGLRFWGPVMRDESSGELPSYANDLRIAMAAGAVNQASFKFRVAPGGETWTIEDDGNSITRTITEIGGLYDVCACPMGAYPATDSQLVRKRAVDFAVSTGRLPEEAGADESNVAPGTEGEQTDTSRDAGGQLSEQQDRFGEDADQRLAMARATLTRKGIKT